MNKLLKVKYLNYKGTISNRLITIKDIYVGTTKYYPTKQILIRVYDHHKGEERIFAANNIVEW